MCDGSLCLPPRPAPCSGGGLRLCPLLAALPRGPLPALPLAGRALPAAVVALRVLRHGVGGPLLPERRHQPHPLQHHVVEIPRRCGPPLRPGRQQPAPPLPHSQQHREGRRLQWLDRVHRQLLMWRNCRSSSNIKHMSGQLQPPPPAAAAV